MNPIFRTDLEIVKQSDESNNYILHDPIGIATDNLLVDGHILDILNLLDGTKDLQTIINQYQESTGFKISSKKLADYIDQIQELGFMQDAMYYLYRTDIEMYIQSDERPYTCADTCYSDNPEELEEELANIIAKVEKSSVAGNAKLVLAPHIDFRLGDIAHIPYSASFLSLRDFEGDLIVLLGTAHYKSSDYFMFTRKHYTTPFGKLQTDLEILDELEQIEGGITYDDMAHKPEHSLELHVVMLQHILKNKNFKILPILTGSLHESVVNKSTPESDENYLKVINGLKQTLDKYNRNYIVLASGDLAHIGRKFGDNYDAEGVLENLRALDYDLIDSLVAGDKNSFFNKIAFLEDKNKICGLPPFYAALSLTGLQKGNAYAYSQWNEKETKSAVSYASLAYYNE